MFKLKNCSKQVIWMLSKSEFERNEDTEGDQKLL